MGMILFYFYRWILLPLVSGILFLLKPFLRGKIQDITRERALQTWIFTKTSEKLESPFWIHAASGEIEYARPLIRELKNKFPQIPVVVTYSSPSAKKILQKMTEVDAWGPSPWDSVAGTTNFLSRVKPRAVFFARTDIWPEISYQLRKQKIPSTLFSATFAENSSRLSGFSKFLTVWTLGNLSRIFVVSEEDNRELKNAAFNAGIIGGDTRFDQVFFRLAHPQILHEKSRPPAGTKTLIAGSTWPEDEEVLFSWFLENRKKSPLNASVNLILAPHEISKARLQKIIDFFKNQGIDCQFYSENKTWNSPVLIVDQIGILAELYTWAQAAFVGGSFRKQVHSVMEPLACGLPVAVGPFHKNNREALQFQKIILENSGQKLVTCVRHARDLENFWQGALGLSESDAIQLQLKVKTHQGATEKLLQNL